ncbi:hypothetical protein M9H77_03851 [Catharanthus roseus]|uniref:Uncharacterized protein n=1 Tax=Catharanthus roseus TaxID=4058 RepID=A0ACC0CCU3_CATRO|nr:hypothetical protein M9H77_03851 [Catharanthus roseus]
MINQFIDSYFGFSDEEDIGVEAMEKEVTQSEVKKRQSTEADDGVQEKGKGKLDEQPGDQEKEKKKGHEQPDVQVKGKENVEGSDSVKSRRGGVRGPSKQWLISKLNNATDDYKPPNKTSTDSEEDSDFYSDESNDEEPERRKFPRFHEEKEGKDPKFKVGQLFPTAVVLKKAITYHVIFHGRDIEF